MHSRSFTNWNQLKYLRKATLFHEGKNYTYQEFKIILYKVSTRFVAKFEQINILKHYMHGSPVASHCMQLANLFSIGQFFNVIILFLQLHCAKIFVLRAEGGTFPSHTLPLQSHVVHT